MVIPFSGALNFFLGLFQLLPFSIRSFIVVVFIVSIALGLLRMILDW